MATRDSLSRKQGIDGRGMKHVAYGQSDIGKVQEKNEDSVLLDGDLGLYIVCDGVSGRSAGEMASHLACSLVSEYLHKNQTLLEKLSAQGTPAGRAEIRKLLESAVQEASITIFRTGKEDSQKSGMSTTLAMVLVAGTDAFVAHVGDSRVYMLRDGETHLLTDDHTLANMYVRRGMMTREKASKSAGIHGLLRALGPQEAVIPDVLIVQLKPNDRFLICSDGLYDYLPTTDLHKYLTHTPVEDIPATTIALANRRGGADNITCIAIETLKDPDVNAAEIDLRIAALRKTPLFEHLNFRDLMKVQSITTVESVPDGQAIIHEGDVGDRMYVIMQGHADVFKAGQRIARLQTGAFFGEMCFIDKSPRSATVTARGAMRVLTIQRRDFVALLSNEDRVATKVLVGLCMLLVQRLRKTGDELSLVKGKLGKISPTDLMAHYLEEDEKK